MITNLSLPGRYTNLSQAMQVSLYMDATSGRSPHHIQLPPSVSLGYSLLALFATYLFFSYHMYLILTLEVIFLCGVVVIAPITF